MKINANPEQENLGLTKRAYRYFAGSLYSLPFFHSSPSLRSLRNCHQSAERCFIIGNGPSIRSQNLTLLANEFTFVANNFVVHDQFTSICPTYYCASDPRFWRHGYLNTDVHQTLLRHSDIVCFFEHTFRIDNAGGRFLPEDRCHYIHVDYRHKVHDGYVSLDPSLRTYHGLSVLIDLCLPLACFMGFKKIYLLGSDCDYGVTEAADFSKAWFHRPDQYKAVFDSLDVARHHFHPVIEGFEQMKKTIAGTGTTIYNATRGGKLEVFERVCYEDLLDKRS